MSYYIISSGRYASDKLVHRKTELNAKFTEISETEAILLLAGDYRKCQGVYCDPVWQAQEKDTAAQARRE
jgi:hypothetical protein